MYDIKMISEGKKRFKDLYVKSQEERQKLRETEGYRLALLDIWEIAATAIVQPRSMHLLGKAAVLIAAGEIKVQKNIDDK